MKLVLKRTALRDTYTIGKLFIDGVFFCNTLEDRDRGLTSTMTLEQIRKIKVYGETAIPYGTYKIDMDTVSPKYSKKANYAKVTDGGKMPRIQNIKGYSGVLMHGGNSDKDTLGCVLVGNNSIVGRLTDSFNTFCKLYTKLDVAHKKGEEITLTIEKR